MRRPFLTTILPVIVLCVTSMTLAGAGKSSHVTTVAEVPGGTGGLVLDAEGRIYSADFGTALGRDGVPGTRLFRIDRDGNSEVFAEGFQGASGVAINSKGQIFQSNIRGNYIARVGADGSVNRWIDGLKNPVGIVIDPDDTLWVANCGGESIQRITPEGASSVFVSDERLKCPNGMTMDSDGNLYTANFYDGNVVKITPAGVLSVLATLPGGNNGHLTFSKGHLYVVDRGGHRIYRVTLDGEATLLAGSGKQGGTDGPALEATFSFPNDIAASADGKTIYVNETGNDEPSGIKLAPTRVRAIHLP